jgi:hypothetical protein
MIMVDPAERAKNIGGKALRMLGTGLKEVAKTTIAGLGSGDDIGRQQDRGVVETYSSREPAEREPSVTKIRAIKKYGDGRLMDKYANLRSMSQPTRVPNSQRKKLVPNPFPRHVSEGLGIPHRDFITQREVELIQKDLRRMA